MKLHFVCLAGHDKAQRHGLDRPVYSYQPNHHQQLRRQNEEVDRRELLQVIPRKQLII